MRPALAHLGLILLALPLAACPLGVPDNSRLTLPLGAGLGLQVGVYEKVQFIQPLSHSSPREDGEIAYFSVASDRQQKLEGRGYQGQAGWKLTLNELPVALSEAVGWLQGLPAEGNHIPKKRQVLALLGVPN